MDYLKKQLEEIDKKIDETKKLLSDRSLYHLAMQEIRRLEEQKESLLAPPQRASTSNKDLNIPKAVLVEIRSAAGGDEAGLFAAQLYRMYTRYADSKKWKVEQVSINEGGIGNIKEVVFRIQSSDAYRYLQLESGVHRVQRVPETESGGRIHTSTATVAVLAEIPETDLQIDPKELKIETYRASGHGGQNVQKVETAVRITHIPTNLVVTCQSERSQFQNKDRAMQILRSRLFEAKKRSEKEGVNLERSLQVGGGQRSEKIRTYNFPQSRVTDHRLNKSWHNLEEVMNGNLDKILEGTRGLG